MYGKRHEAWVNYAFAMCVTALVLVGREALSGWLGRSNPFLPAIAAVLIASLRGGLGPGLVATALSAAASDFFFVSPVFSLRMTKIMHGADLLLFVLVGVLISSLCDKRLRLVRQLREADRRKDEFLGILAHELRNPLAPVSNALELWPTVENDRTETRRLRDLSQRHIQQMVRLIDDLMDVSRITHGKIQLRRERVDLVTVASSAVETLEPFIKSCGHELSIVLPAAPLFVDGDLCRLTQVVGNVLHNAAKYSGRNGSILLVVEQDGATAVVRVKDNGPGIPADMLARIFEMFEQVGRTLDSSHGGMGIGLTLAKRLIELHGGTIEARSEGTGKGSEFIIALPLLSDTRDVAFNRAEFPSVRSLPQFSRRRILVVDDLQESATMLAMLLQAMGQDATAVCDGRAAVDWVLQNKPDLVFLDIAMPGMDGFEAARRIRETAFHDIVLVALSGYGHDADRRRAFAAGFDQYLTKPVNMGLLRKLLSNRSLAGRRDNIAKND